MCLSFLANKAFLLLDTLFDLDLLLDVWFIGDLDLILEPPRILETPACPAESYPASFPILDRLFLDLDEFIDLAEWLLFLKLPGITPPGPVSVTLPWPSFLF